MPWAVPYFAFTEDWWCQLGVMGSHFKQGHKREREKKKKGKKWGAGSEQGVIFVAFFGRATSLVAVANLELNISTSNWAPVGPSNNLLMKYLKF